jgi:flagellar assembly protein FliH
MTTSPQRFAFDTIFDGDAVITPPRPKRHFTAEEVEAARVQGYAEGQASAVARAEAEAARALGEIAAATRSALSSLVGLAHEHQAGAARLAVVAAQKIADAALDRFPEAPAQAALDALAIEIEAAPRLLVFAAPADVPRLEQALGDAAARAGYAGQIVFKPEPGRTRAAFQFDWGEGRAAFDPEAAAERIGAALETALAAEAAQLPPGSP